MFITKRALPIACFTFLLTSFTAAAPANASPSQDIEIMRKDLAQQVDLIKSQQNVLNAQKEQLVLQEKEIETHRAKLEKLMQKVSAFTDQQENLNIKTARVLTDHEKKIAVGAGVKKTTRSPFIAPEKKVTRPDIPALANAGGVLTPKGELVYENTLEYLNTTNNVFTFDGVELAELVFVGVTNTSTAVRQILQDSHRLRLGLTNRLEADIRIPYVYRNDRNTNTSTSAKTTIEGNGIGDIDFGVAYQMNEGKENWPFFVGNLRYKTNNADGPFDVSYDANNVAEDLPTGTGFHSVEASLTAIKVSDPAVLFANLGYVYNFSRSIEKSFGNTRVFDVDPGNAVNASAGMGFSINPDLSFTLGYKHSYVFSTTQESQTISTGVYSTSESDDSNVGALIVGASYNINPFTSLNMNVEIGATREAPDVRVGFRVPIKLGKVF